MCKHEVNKYLSNLSKNDTDANYFNDEVHHYLKYIKLEKVRRSFKMYKII